MNGFLTELGKKLAERWFSLLVLPGALFLGVLAAGRTLGHTRWYDVHALTERLGTHTAAPSRSSASLFLLLVAFLLAAAACGLAAQALGSLMERLWLAADWPGWPRPAHRPVLRLIARRRHRYNSRLADLGGSAADDHALDSPARNGPSGDAPGGAIDPLPADHRTAVARHRLDRIADTPPARPTWTGDRLHAVDVRLRTDLGIAVAAVWPLLWLHVPDTTRVEITTAREGMHRAATLAGWALLYLAVTVVWWPGLPLSAAVMATAWYRFRTTTDTYATLVEAATRLHVRDLAQHLGLLPLEDAVPVTLRQGIDLTAYVTNGQTPPAA